MRYVNFSISILIICFYFGCKSSLKNSENSDSISLNETTNKKVDSNLIKDDTITKVIGEYIVKVKQNDNGDVGSVTIITNKKTGAKFTFDSGPEYFLDIVGDKAIFDNGTDVLRGLSVFDLKNNKNQFESNYIDSLNIKDGKIYFKHVFFNGEQPDKQPDTTGLAAKVMSTDVYIVEDWIYDLDKDKVTKLGNVRYEP